MKKIKYLMLTLMMVLGVGVASAQEGTSAVGFNLGYATGDGINNLGIGVKYSYQMSDNLRVQPSFTYYFEKDNANLYDLSVDFHYLFNFNDDKMAFYPIFGFTTPFYHFNGDEGIESHTWTRFGCNLGAGLQYKLTDDFALVGEAKYKIVKDIDHVAIAIGCVVSF